MVVMNDVFTVYYGSGQISAGHDQTSYASYYIGGLPASLRHRYGGGGGGFRSLFHLNNAFKSQTQHHGSAAEGVRA